VFEAGSADEPGAEAGAGVPAGVSPSGGRKRGFSRNPGGGVCSSLMDAHKKEFRDKRETKKA
jgi:hypothetical protein